MRLIESAETFPGLNLFTEEAKLGEVGNCSLRHIKLKTSLSRTCYVCVCVF